ncbi:hypothetical protein [Streptomyces sp. NPDC048644]|uniref:hypothetical protein n=1 Tax=Streptomyces sp. NPDC048644 TaxID=3365582 RepID=UPI00371EB838
MGGVQGNRRHDPRLPGVRREGLRGGRVRQLGKLIGAIHAIRDFSDELEADFLEFFGVDLLDVWRGRLSLRRVHVLIQSLIKKPGRSTFLAQVDESASWSVMDHLLARVSDATEISNYLFIKANSEGPDELQVPEPVQRPGQGTQEKPKEPEHAFADGAELSSFFTRMSNL